MHAGGTGSADAVGHRPQRLMQRLALIGQPEQAAGTGDMQRRAGAALFFALGVIGGTLAGVAALMALDLLGSSRVRHVGDQGVAVVAAALGPWISGPSAASVQVPPRIVAPAAAVVHQQPPDIFDMAIDRRSNAPAAFALRLVGAEGEDFQVRMRDVPAAAVLSHGRQSDAATWMVASADLKSLQLTLADGAPDAFDIRIDVLARGGVAAGSSVARVRLVALPGNATASAIAVVERAPDEAPASTAPAADAAQGKQVQAAAVTTVPARIRGREEKSKTANPAPPAVVQRHWPDGASALGGMTPPPSERQVWWKMPPPTWSPFLDTGATSLP